MRHLILVMLLVFTFCKDANVKDIEIKYDDRSEFVQDIEDKTSKVPNVNNSKEIDELKTYIGQLTKEIRTLNSENKQCQLTKASQSVEIDGCRKDLKKAEWYIGFVNALKWLGYTALGILSLIAFLYFLSKIPKGKIPFIS